MEHRAVRGPATGEVMTLHHTLEAFSDTVVGHRAPDLGWLAYSAVFGGLFVIGAVAAFRKSEPYFAESV